MATHSFDLNIEEVLEDWDIAHALREVIANSLDEQVLSETAEIEISTDEHSHWHIRDFGRGLRIEHFTLNENQEKLNSPSGVIGKFGVGLKDALATFYRRGVAVTIVSPFGTFSLKQDHKHGFDDILTLHVRYNDTPNRSSLNFPVKSLHGSPSSGFKLLKLPSTFRRGPLSESLRSAWS